jgi:hypothetical protein
MKMNKFLHEFTINKETEVEEIEISKNEKNEEVKTTKKQKKIEAVPFRLMKPNRKLFDEAELFYGIKISEGIKAGLLTRSLLAKRYQNDGGSMSEVERRRYTELYIELYRLENELQRLQLNLEKLSKDEQINKMGIVLNDLSVAKKELQQIENYQSTIFDQTAENRARNQTILWWVLNISYIKEDQEFAAFFGEGDYDKKLAIYDEYEESEDFFKKEAMSKLAYFISLWYMGKANSTEDFKNLELLFEQASAQPKEIEPQTKKEDEIKSEKESVSE